MDSLRAWDVNLRRVGDELDVRHPRRRWVEAYPDGLHERIAVFTRRPPGPKSAGVAPPPTRKSAEHFEDRWDRDEPSPDEERSQDEVVYERYEEAVYKVPGDVARWLGLDELVHTEGEPGGWRIRVWTDDPCWDLPLEFAAGPDGPLHTRPGVSLVRAVPVNVLRPLAVDEGAVHLVATFVEDAPGHHLLDLSGDRRDFRLAVNRHRTEATAGVEAVVTEPSFTALSAVLREIDGPAVLYIAGPGKSGKIGFKDGWFTADQLLEVCQPERVHLVVLASCDSAKSVNAGENVALQLVRGGVPAVVGMSTEAETTLARLFSTGLFEQLLAGETIDEAVREGRSKMAGAARLLQHGVPVLVTGVDDRSATLTAAHTTLLPRRIPPPGSESSRRRIRPGRQVTTAHEVGREHDLDRVRAHLADRRCTVLTGRRGVGKSHTARRIVQESEADVVWWVTADSEASLVGDLAKLADRLGISAGDSRSGGGGAGSAEAKLARDAVDWLSDAEVTWLLVIDNVDDAELASSWLPHAPDGCAVLLTTVDARPWGGLAVPLEPLDEHDAVELLVRVTGIDDTTDMLELVELVDRLPLAVVQAGSYMAEETDLTVREYIARLQASIADLAEKAPVDHSRSMLAITNDALDQLSVVERRFLAMLCHLALDALPRLLLRSQATATVLGTTSDVLDLAVRRLRRLGLIEMRPGGGPARIHRLTARLVLEQTADLWPPSR